MLKKLGQWLRIAGYDVLMLDDGAQDRQLLETAISEGRYLLTRDTKMLEYKQAKGVVILLVCNDLNDCVDELNNRLDIDWSYKPFSRCKQCNSELVEADESTMVQMPTVAKKHATETRYCPQCQQLFWDGSHVSRMRKQLAIWSSHQKHS